MEDIWEERRQVGDDMWETTGSCGRQVENHQQAIGIPHPESAGRKHLGNLIWKTSGDICETTARRGSRDPALCMGKGEEVKIPPSAPRDWNKMKSKLGDRQSWETRWKMKCSGRHSGRHKDTVTVGDKLGDTAGDK